MQAAEWLVKIQSEDMTEDTLDDLKAWRLAHPDHERAWQRVQTFGDRLRNMSHPLLHKTLHMSDSAEAQHQRRQVLKMLVWGSVFGGTAWWAVQQQPWQQWQADYKTAVGQQQTVTLADGSQLVLNTDSAVQVEMDDTQRLIRLLKGEVFVRTAPDGRYQPGRPFFVGNRDGMLKALGTVFSVRQFEQRSLLCVVEGRVSILTKNSREFSLVQAGQQVYFSADHIELASSLNEEDTAWASGMLVVHKMPLPQFLDELKRYYPYHLAYDDSIAGLEVSGVFPLQNTTAILETLQGSLPVTLDYRTRFWVDVKKRSVDS